MEQMALVNHKVQGSYAIFPSKVVSRTNGLEFIQFGTLLSRALKTNNFFVIRQHMSSSSVGAPLVCAPNTKLLKITAFKGNAKNDGSRGRTNGSKSAKLSFTRQESESLFTESREMEDVRIPYSSEVKRISRSLAIQNLFKNWLALMCSSPPSNEAADETLEGSDPGRIQMEPDLSPEENQGNILTQIWRFFLGLDAAVKVPLLIFTPLYLAVNLAYGVQVSKELTPLWIFGPLILALYVKLFRVICALYVFTFKQTAKILKNSPASYSYIADGKLKEDIHVRLWQPMLEIKNKNYNELSKMKVKELQMWVGEKYVDCLEFIWPTYCRIVRFLKRANLI